MERHVAVQVQYPQLSYVDLLPLRGRMRAQRRLSPIEVNQQVAVVRLFLMRRDTRSGGVLIPERPLHTFRIPGLPTGDDTTPVITLEVEHTRARTVHLKVSGAGITPQVADVRVPRTRPRWWLLLLLVAFLLAGIGAWGLIRFSPVALRGVPPSTTNDEPAEHMPSETPASAESDARPDQTDASRSDDAPQATEETATPDAPDTEPREALDGEEEAARLQPTEVSVYFEPNRTTLTEAARRELDRVASTVQDHPDVPVSIVGHTALYGTEDGRTEISRGRAQAVAAYLRSRGWEPRTEPTVEWVGSQDPVTRDRDQQQRNRRVEIFIHGDQSSR
ncbi:MAG: OmpA family protein [Alkalispirochaeta sp.]